MNSNEGSKRRRSKHNDKSEAFMKLKKLKTAGVKNKYELEPLESVYEEITEDEYTNRVLKRQNDNWIVDDGDVDGYIEDGREIFDDDITDNFKNETKHKKSKYAIGKQSKPENGIKKMFTNLSAKKKPEVKRVVTVKDDDILGNLINELSSANTKNNFVDTTQKSEVIQNIHNTTLRPSVHNDSHTLDVKNNLSDRSIVQNYSNKVVDDIDNDLNLEFKNNIVAVNSCGTVDNLDPVTELNKRDVVSPVKDIVNDINWDDDFSEPSMDDMFSDINDIQLITEDKDMNNEKEQLLVCDEDLDTKTFRFFYWDAYEDNNRPGMVFLFGKTLDTAAKSYVSCCVVVKNIERRIFLLPKEEVNGNKVTLLDVYNEFNEKIATKYKIMEFKTKKVKKNYAFNLPSVPDESEYLEIRYSASYPYLPIELEGDTFSHIFGTRTSFLEHLLLEKAIKGPCWLEISSPEYATNNLSWCKIEVICNDYDHIGIIQNGKSPPPLVIAALNISTAVLPKSNDNCILMISCLVNNNYQMDNEKSLSCSSRFCAFTRPADVPWPLNLKEILSKQKGPIKFERMDSERALLSYFLAKMCQIDPDVIIGHDIHGFDMGVLIHRLITNKISQWSRIGRLRRNQPPTFGKNSNVLERNILCGRLLCDTKIMAKELICCRSYDLKSLFRMITNPGGEEEKGNNDHDDNSSVAGEEIKNAFNNMQSLINFIRMKNQELIYIIKIMNNLNILPLAVQITNIAGNVLSRTLLGGRSERNEFLLLHAFHSKNYIVPDKISNKFKKSLENTEGNMVEVTKGNQKSQYEGGLVLEPKRGFYDKMILLLDFNSLYPSIIQEYNICFTTIPLRLLSSMDGKEDTLLSKSCSLPPGILPTEIRKLVESRCEVKKLLQKTDLPNDARHKYNIRQLALKLTANSMYGCLGFSQSRFYAKPLAALVTAKGREILMNSRDLVQKLNYDVIYGDTDSIMINTNSLDYDEVYKIGYKIKGEINKLYKKIELDIDAVFKYMLLLKKKKYAAISIKKQPNGVIQSKNEIKGLDIVRRDWSIIASEVGRYVVLKILSDCGIDEKVETIQTKLKEVKAALEEDKIPLKKLTITKQLTKNPNEYPDGKNLPHVQVALRVNTTISKQFKRGDTIPYVICKDGSDSSAAKRAYHIDEVKANDNLKLDLDYYLSQQIFPVVSRLCEPVSAIDATDIAKCLGLNLSLSNNNQQNEVENYDDASAEFSENKFQNCDQFAFKCINPTCVDLIEVDIPTEKDGKISTAFDHYTINQCDTSLAANLPHIQNTLCMSVRGFIQKYYRSRANCEDNACAKSSRRLSCISKNGILICNHCSKGALTTTYTESELYNQLCYLQGVFDLPQAMQTIKNLKVHHESDCFLAYVKLKGQMDNYLQYSAYNYINLRNFCTVPLRKKGMKCTKL